MQWHMCVTMVLKTWKQVDALSLLASQSIHQGVLGSVRDPNSKTSVTGIKEDTQQPSLTSKVTCIYVHVHTLYPDSHNAP